MDIFSKIKTKDDVDIPKLSLVFEIAYKEYFAKVIDLRNKKWPSSESMHEFLKATANVEIIDLGACHLIEEELAASFPEFSTTYAGLRYAAEVLLDYTPENIEELYFKSRWFPSNRAASIANTKLCVGLPSDLIERLQSEIGLHLSNRALLGVVDAANFVKLEDTSKLRFSDKPYYKKMDFIEYNKLQSQRFLEMIASQEQELDILTKASKILESKIYVHDEFDHPNFNKLKNKKLNRSISTIEATIEDLKDGVKWSESIEKNFRRYGNFDIVRNKYWIKLLEVWGWTLRIPITYTTDPITDEIRGPLVSFISVCSEIIIETEKSRSPSAIKSFLRRNPKFKVAQERFIKSLNGEFPAYDENQELDSYDDLFGL